MSNDVGNCTRGWRTNEREGNAAEHLVSTPGIEADVCDRTHCEEES